MHEEPPLSDEQIEAMVRTLLEESAREIDPQPLLVRLQDRLETSSETLSATLSGATPTGTTTKITTKVSPARRRRRWGVAIAAAAVLALSAVGVIYVWPSSTLAATLVLASKRVHELPVDRCYLIEVQPAIPEDAYAPDRLDRLWTRGDRFFIESCNQQYRWAWGQDDTGAVWLTDGRQRGLRLERSELPTGLRMLCDTFSMHFETLLGQLLGHFDLTWEAPDAGTLPLTRVVHALRKPGHPDGRVQEARLEIDAETKVIRKLTVKRWCRGNSTDRRLVTVTFTLAGSQAQPDLCYQPAGHLEAPFVIFSREHEPEKRNAVLSRLYGAWILKGSTASR
jgi:hypothetical protein